jgi:hypothetical protein
MGIKYGPRRNSFTNVVKSKRVLHASENKKLYFYMAKAQMTPPSLTTLVGSLRKPFLNTDIYQLIVLINIVAIVQWLCNKRTSQTVNIE